MIRLDGVGHAFGNGPTRREVLRDVDVELREQRIGVIGANGSGKSTFARLLNGLVLPTRGTVTVDGLQLPATVLGRNGPRTQVRFTKDGSSYVRWFDSADLAEDADRTNAHERVTPPRLCSATPASSAA